MDKRKELLNVNKERYPDHSVRDDFCDNVDVAVSQAVGASQRVERDFHMCTMQMIK